MTVDSASFKIRFPEFDAVADARVQLFLDDAVVILNEEYWGVKYDLGVSYYAAHNLAIGIETEAGSAGSLSPVASRAVDGVSISFTNATPTDQTDAFLSSTAYGQKYLSLRKTLGAIGCVI